MPGGAGHPRGRLRTHREAPLFLTVTRTRGPGEHTDVSLWYVVNTGADSITSYDEEEFTAIRSLTSEQVLGEPLDSVDPHMHRVPAGA